MNSRILYFDFLRVLATFAVILLHISGSVFDPEAQCSLGEYWFGIGSNAATRWAVPCFVMLSGALFLNPQKEITLKKLYGKYVLRLLVIFLSWTLLYTFLFNPSLFWIKGLSPVTPHLSFVYNYPFHLWFIPMLIGVEPFVQAVFYQSSFLLCFHPVVFHPCVCCKFVHHKASA